MLRQIQEQKQAIVLIYAGADVRPPVELITGDLKTIGLAVDVLEIFQVADLQ